MAENNDVHALPSDWALPPAWEDIPAVTVETLQPRYQQGTMEAAQEELAARLSQPGRFIPNIDPAERQEWLQREQGMGNAGLNTMTLGAAPHLIAAVESLGPATYQESLQSQEQLRNQLSPGDRIAAELAGAIGPALFTGGASLPGNFFGRLAIGAGIGGAGAATAGYLEGPGPLFSGDRVQNALDYAPWGLGLGAAAPLAGQFIGSATQRIRNIWRNRNLDPINSRVIEEAYDWVESAPLEELTPENVAARAPRLVGDDALSHEGIETLFTYYDDTTKRVYSLFDRQGLTVPTHQLSGELRSLREAFGEADTLRFVGDELSGLETLLARPGGVSLSVLERRRQTIAKSMRQSGIDPNRRDALGDIRDLIDRTILDQTEAMGEAHELWLATLRMGTLEDAAWKASLLPGDYLERLRTQLRRIAFRKKSPEWLRFTPDQRQAIQDFITTKSPIEGLNNMVNAMFPSQTMRSIVGVAGLWTGNLAGTAPLGVNMATNVTGSVAQRAAGRRLAEAIGTSTRAPVYPHPLNPAYATVPAFGASLQERSPYVPPPQTGGR